MVIAYLVFVIVGKMALKGIPGEISSANPILQVFMVSFFRRPCQLLSVALPSGRGDTSLPMQRHAQLPAEKTIAERP